MPFGSPSQSKGKLVAFGSETHGKRVAFDKSAKTGSLAGMKKGQREFWPCVNGGDEEDRTPDLRIANATLSQLSYVPMGAYFIGKALTLLRSL